VIEPGLRGNWGLTGFGGELSAICAVFTAAQSAVWWRVGISLHRANGRDRVSQVLGARHSVPLGSC